MNSGAWVQKPPEDLFEWEHLLTLHHPVQYRIFPDYSNQCHCPTNCHSHRARQDHLRWSCPETDAGRTVLYSWMLDQVGLYTWVYVHICVVFLRYTPLIKSKDAMWFVYVDFDDVYMHVLYDQLSS